MCLSIGVYAGHAWKITVKSHRSAEVAVNNKKCPACGCEMKRNGRTGSGAQRWRCRACGASSTHANDSAARDLRSFVGWLLSKDTQLDMPGQGRTFRRKTSRFWGIWPMPEVVDEIHRVVFVDGIWIARDLIALIACSELHVLSWHLARAETASAWRSLLSRIAPPDMVVTDGGSGFASAAAKEWPETKVQRCTFHAFCQVRRKTTRRPKLQAGKELYALAKELLHIETLHQADWWVERYMQWCEFWADFLEETSIVDGRRVYTHGRIREARSGLTRLVSKGVLFTYLDPSLTAEGPMPAMNNRIEGAINAQLRAVLRNHRGLSALKRAKAVFWWCYLHVESPKSMADTLREMPTDADVERLRDEYGVKADEVGAPQKWGEGLVWDELHHATRYPYATE